MSYADLSPQEGMELKADWSLHFKTCRCALCADTPASIDDRPSQVIPRASSPYLAAAVRAQQERLKAQRRARLLGWCATATVVGTSLGLVVAELLK